MERITKPLQKDEPALGAAETIAIEKPWRHRWLFSVFAIGLALAVALSLALAGDAEAKKKKHKKHPPVPTLNVVQCSANPCNGTDAADYLLGTYPSANDMYGGEGNDVYEGKGASLKGDYLLDKSTTSNDTYLFPATEFGGAEIWDQGGNFDVIDLGSYRYSDFTFEKFDRTSDGIKESLYIGGPGGARNINLLYQYTSGGKIEYFRFLDGTRTADQIQAS